MTAHEKAYKEGRLAGENPGKNTGDNPYSERSALSQSWLEGFRKGWKTYLRQVEASRKAYDASN